MKILTNYFMVVGLLVISTSIHAAGLSVPNTFSSGTPAIAAEVNRNFDAVKTAVDDNDSRITIIESALSALQSTVSSQTATISSLTNNLSSANNAISDLQSLLALKANANHNHNAIYSPILHNHTGVYAPVSHGHSQGSISGLSSALSTHASQISAINNSDVMDLDAYLTISTTGGAKATLSGINLQIVNGLGSTSTINGLGNLIVGYNENNTATDVWLYSCSSGQYTTQSDCESNGEIWGNSHKTGSHYLVLGTQNNYSQYGGMVAGLRNTTNRNYSTATGGRENRVLGSYSSVSGGYRNVVTGHYSSVSGGYRGGAFGAYSSVTGGNENFAFGSYSSVTGGRYNDAYGSYSSISGGRGNNSGGSYSSVSGGLGHSAGGVDDWRAGSLFETE